MNKPLNLLVLLIFAVMTGSVRAQSEESEVLALKTLSTYCYDCHQGEDGEGGIAVDFFEAGDDLGRRVEVVEKIIRVLKEQEMPPSDSEQPTAKERVATLEWIQQRLEDFDCGEVSGPGRVTIQRLNRIEYDNTVRDLTGLELNLSADFPSDDVGNGFDNIGDVLTLPPILMEKYIDAATTVALEVVADPVALERVFPHAPEDPENIEQIVEAAKANAEYFATRAFRRPASEEEVERLFNVMKSAFERNASQEQIQAAAIATILSSPHFIYRVELDRPRDFVDGIRQLNDYEIASRLSYFLWSTTPDEELLRLARLGKLETDEQLQSQVDRMLDDPKSEALVRNFAGQWLQLRDLAGFSPDPDLFASFDEKLRQSMRRETELLFETLMDENLSVLDLLSADYSFIDERLAEHYGIDFSAAPGQPATADGFRKVALDGRRGILMHASVLAITSNPTRTSPVKRGKWILDNLLGEPPPPPPPDVAELGEGGENLGTLRQQMEEHRSNPNCAVCHTKMDALGFSLENFDVIGKWRDNDGRYRIDPSGNLPSGRKFDGPVDLVQILAEDKNVEFTRCFAKKLMTYAIGRGLGVEDRCTINTITEEAAADDLRFRTIVKSVVCSVPFRYQAQAQSRN